MGFADRMIFLPPPPSYGEGPDVRLLSADDGTRVAILHLPLEGAALTVLFAHGNAEDIGDLAPFAARIRELGVSVLAFDYPGYGLSTGRPSEDGSYRAASTAHDYLVDSVGVAPEAIVAHGRSLGGAVMADLAARAPVGGLVLESTFVSAYRVMTRVPLLPFDQFTTLRSLSRVTAPVLVVHGDRDEVIPVWHGRRLFRAVPDDRRRALWVPGAGHNDLALVAGEAYWTALSSFLERVAGSETGR